MSLFAPATREKAKLRLALTGPSGAGKTLSALYVAYGLTGDWGKVALLDTERNRAKLYANREDLDVGQFLHAELVPPYSPDRYVNYIQEGAAAVGSVGVVIVDSLSHAWNNEGGVLEIKDRIASGGKHISYTAWNEAGKQQNKLINNILAVDCHVIVTMRSKMDYVLETNEKGKQVPRKVGLAPIQRDDTEYEFDIVMDLGRDHVASASKDTTFLDAFSEVITPQLGKELRVWLDEGLEPERCEECKERIRPSRTKSVAEIIAATKEKCGKQLCLGCANKWHEEHAQAGD